MADSVAAGPHRNVRDSSTPHRHCSPRDSNNNYSQFDDASDDFDFEIPIVVACEKNGKEKCTPLKNRNPATPLRVATSITNANTKTGKNSTDRDLSRNDDMENSEEKFVVHDFCAQRKRNHQLMVQGLKERMDGDNDDDGYESAGSCQTASSHEEDKRTSNRMNYSDDMEIGRRLGLVEKETDWGTWVERSGNGRPKHGI